MPPYFDKSTPPPIHYRWPEYVTTERGQEWWIGRQPEAVERPG